MQPLSLADELIIIPGGDGISMECDHPDLPQDETNLIWQAALIFEKRTYQKVRARIILHKRLPVAAGLGGGSSDAATTLLELNDLAGNPLDARGLEQVAAELGADVPFFLFRKPMVAKGIGTRLTPVNLPAYSYLLYNPGVPLSTRWVYENLDPDRLSHLPTKRKWNPDHPERWVHNDLAKVALRRLPELAVVLDAFERLGAVVQGVSGSGPTTFGVFPSLEGAYEAGQTLRRILKGWLAVAQGLTGHESESVWENRVWMI